MALNEESPSLPFPPRKIRRPESHPAVIPFAAGFFPDGLLFGRYLPQSGGPSAGITSPLKSANAGVSARRSITLAEDAVSISISIGTVDCGKSDCVVTS